MTQDEIEARGEFTPRTQGEIDRNLFAARTGGLVAISGVAFFELFYAAKAWQRHLAEKPRAVAFCPFGTVDGKRVALAQYAAESAPACADKVMDVARREGFKGTQRERLEELGWSIEPLVSPLAPQARDTTPSKESGDV